MSLAFIKPQRKKIKLLNPDYIPTPITRREDKIEVEILELSAHKRVNSLVVILRFLSFGLRIFMRKLLKKQDEMKTAQETRQLFQGLGGLWIKLGQLLSLRSDIFSDAVCNELSSMLYASVGFPPAIVRQRIEQELGCPIDEIFSEFDEIPLAAASIAQVHKAVLRKEGVAVVVKVRRPNVASAFRRDLFLLRKAVKIISWLVPVRHLRLEDGLTELDAIVEEELDYAFEASNIKRLRKSLRKHGVYVPYLFSEYCTGKLLVMEEIHGVLMSEVIAVMQTDPERYESWCETNEIKPKKVANHLFLSNMRQLLEDNMFHGDMHPGNIVLLRENRYALIDFGTIGSLDKDFLQLYMSVLRAISRREYNKAADLSLHMCIEIPSVDLSQLRAELVRSFKLWQARSELEKLAYNDRSLTASNKITGQVFAKYKLQISWAALRMGRTWGTLDTSLVYLHPQMNHSRMFTRYLKQAEQRQKENALKNMREGVGRMIETATEYGVLFSPIAQRAAITYKQKINKLSAVAATVMRFTYIAVIGTLIFAVHAFLHQHYIDLSAMPGSALLDDAPMIEKEWFIVGIVGLILASVMIKKIISIVNTAYLR